MYASIQDIKDSFGERHLIQLTTENRNATEPDEEIITRFRDRAEATINAYLTLRYALPVSASAKAALLPAAVAITRYRLMLRRAQMTPEVENDYKRTMKWLRAVSEGDILLPDDAQSNSPSEVASVGLLGSGALTFPYNV